MKTLLLLTNGWNADPIVVVTLSAVTLAYLRFFRRGGRLTCFIAAIVLIVIALLSPLNAIAQGVLFSVHMTQHILLLLIVPGLVLLSLPEFAPKRGTTRRRSTTTWSRTVSAWVAGIGAMWFWHAPAACDAAATVPSIHALQTITLLGAGLAFWWPIIGPRPDHRLVPGIAIAYLFTACLACTALGMILTLGNVEICPAFRSPLAPSSFWRELRPAGTARSDQQIGGLLMWVPMCAVYVAAIVIALLRWLGAPTRADSAVGEKGAA